MKKTIAIIGQGCLGATNIRNIFKSSGINEYNLEMHLDYNSLKSINYDKYRYNDKYVGIMFGPVPHSVHCKYDSTSIITHMENEEGFPHIVRLWGNKELKITNASIKKGIIELKNSL